MCIVAIAWQVVEDMPLCLISNRDEFYARPSTALNYWTDSPIIAGQDLVSGGTWLGMTKTGRWAVITNYRDGQAMQSLTTSRGKIITDFLNSDLAPIRFARQLEAKQQHYAGFNVIFGTREQAVYMSNLGDAPQVLAYGVYVLSNTTMGQFWHKNQKFRMRFTQELLPLLGQPHVSDMQLEQVVWDILQDARQLSPDQLPNTGIAKELEQLLSSTFIQSAEYGTRCSNFLRLYRERADWIEKQHANRSSRTRLQIQLNAAI
ncbi:NRDE family protein [Acinetobacter sp. MD2(2019)]|uniref:NRDE family protein n=1 Tax=Acinetobacter sp. MD2(2019) TaxID=2605273 RepID=UPI002D1F139E|nr:NRDE family protein [Acinetobacter sp. MD2(2019)]MEB3754644.1 NRDE family protein [Acinetobacter sp. MD2(2019)]